MTAREPVNALGAGHDSTADPHAGLRPGQEVMLDRSLRVKLLARKSAGEAIIAYAGATQVVPLSSLSDIED